MFAISLTVSHWSLIITSDTMCVLEVQITCTIKTCSVIMKFYVCVNIASFDKVTSHSCCYKVFFFSYFILLLL